MPVIQLRLRDYRFKQITEIDVDHVFDECGVVLSPIAAASARPIN